MFAIDKNIIKITRSDDAVIEVTLINDDETEYEMQDGDTLTMTVREKPSESSEVVFSSTSTTNRIVINSADTANRRIGKYSADIQLTTADGKRITVFPRLTGANEYSEINFKNFIIMPEVTRT